MSDVASLERCKELYELSGWEANSVHGWRWRNSADGERWFLDHLGAVPAYTLGYLFRKLPPDVVLEKMHGLDEEGEDKEYYQVYRLVAEHHTGETALENGTEWLRENEQNADTPEDAACELAIELIKQKVIKP